MNPTRLILALSLAAAAAVPLAARSAAAEPSDAVSLLAANSGASVVTQNEAEKHRLEAQGFPQYTD